MKKNIYTEVATGFSPLGNFEYTGFTLGNIIDHEGIHVTDFLLNGMALKPKGDKYEPLIYKKNILINNGRIYDVGIEYPILEKRAMEQSEILNRINNESVIKREFYNPNSIKIKPLF